MMRRSPCFHGKGFDLVRVILDANRNLFNFGLICSLLGEIQFINVDFLKRFTLAARSVERPMYASYQSCH